MTQSRDAVTRPRLALPAILHHAGPLLAGYDVVFCDVWGVVHDGLRAYAAAADALVRFRRGGGTVVLVSNSPAPSDGVAAMLDRVGLRRDAYDAIVSSGDITLAHLAEKGFRRVLCVGPRDRDARLFARLAAEPAPIETAEAILCSGLDDDRFETADTYRPLLAAARERDLPFVCANPDLVVAVGDRLYPCAGAIAAIYEEMGGAVFWAGKPHAIAYETALETAEGLRRAAVPRQRILAIGDSVRTDLAGAANFGVDALFIASGIHWEELAEGGVLSAGRVTQLLAGACVAGVMEGLGW